MGGDVSGQLRSSFTSPGRRKGTIRAPDRKGPGLVSRQLGVPALPGPGAAAGMTGGVGSTVPQSVTYGTCPPGQADLRNLHG